MPAIPEFLRDGRYRITQASADENETSLEAVDTTTNSQVVLRKMPGRKKKAATSLQQEAHKLAFSKLAKMLTELKHESLLPIQDYFAEGDNRFVVNDSVDGDTLDELLQRNKNAFPLSDVLEWTDQLLDAVNYLHTASTPVVHKNIRPENIVLCSNGRVKLFGIAAEDCDGAADPEMRYAPLEQIWGGLDTASQNAIINGVDERSERILKEPADARSDIYSLGATLYYLITGQEPVGALERAIEMMDGKADPLKEPSKLDERIPAEISDVLMKALEIRRENRYDLAAIMRQVMKTAKLRAVERLSAGTDEEKEIAEQLKAAEPAPKAKVKENAKPAPKAEAEPEAKAKAEPEPAPKAVEAEEKAKPAVMDAAPPVYSAADEDDDDGPSFGDDPGRSGLGMPVIAVGAVAAVVLIAVIGFFVFSGGDAPKAPVQTAIQSQPAQPADAAPVAAAVPESSPEPVAEAAPSPDASDKSRDNDHADSSKSDSKQSAKATPTPKPKKESETPAKPAKEKKAVTVDDLISGN